MSVVFSRRTLLATAATLAYLNHSLAATKNPIGIQTREEIALLETYGGAVKYFPRFPMITRTGADTAVYFNRMLPPEGLGHLDVITAQLVVRHSGSWELIHKSTLLFEKIKAYIVREEFTVSQRDITATLFIANVESNTKKAML